MVLTLLRVAQWLADLAVVRKVTVKISLVSVGFVLLFDVHQPVDSAVYKYLNSIRVIILGERKADHIAFCRAL